MNKAKRLQSRGFTLIELLVVIAIIGLLASVILASLNSARAKGSDAAIKSDLNNARAQAELYYGDNKNSYSGVCAAALSATPGGIKGMVDGAAGQIGATVGTVAFTYDSGGAAGSAVCHDSSSGWAAIVSLKNPTTASSGWCVDSDGYSGETTTLSASSVTCGS